MVLRASAPHNHDVRSRTDCTARRAQTVPPVVVVARGPDTPQHPHPPPAMTDPVLTPPPREMHMTRVLVVDDNAMFIEMTRFVLTAAGYQVDVASRASQALLQIPVCKPDVILMDIQMPDTDGIRLTRQLKADPADPADPADHHRRLHRVCVEGR